jgi:hypothetical protein
MDFRLKSDLASYYSLAGDAKQYRQLMAEIIEELAPGLDTAPLEALSQYNPLVILLQSYEALGQYDKALEVLQRIERSYGTTGGVKEFVIAKRLEMEMAKKNQKNPADSNFQKPAVK